MSVTVKPRKKHFNDQVVYFASWAGYHVPFRPQHPLSKEEALDRGHYYLGEYDSDGRLVLFEKYDDGQRAWADRYSYWRNGKLKERVQLGERGRRRQHFDKRGRLEHVDEWAPPT